MSIFVESLLTNHNLNSIVAAALHSIQPGTEDRTHDFTALNMWYERLDKRYNFSLGSVILPLLTSDDLTQLLTLNPPYLDYYKGNMNEEGHINMSMVHGKTYKIHCKEQE